MNHTPQIDPDLSLIALIVILGVMAIVVILMM